MNNKYVLFICGGKWQRPWLQYLKNKGHKIILVDPFVMSPSVPEADIHIICDAKDTQHILRVISENQYEIEFVTSDQTDVSTTTVAALSEQLGLFTNRLDVVELFANKFKSREFLSHHVTSHYPPFIKATSPDDVISFFYKVSGPIIIKPIDAQSSRGIFKIDHSNLGHVASMLKEALSFSKENYIIAEKFLIGKEVTVEGICIDNNHHTLATSSKKHFRMGIASELRYPSTLKPSLLQELIEFHNDFIKKTGLRFGITHSEYIINEEETDFWLVETACRGGGSLIPSHIVPWVSGINLYDVFYKLVTEQPVAIREPANFKHAILYFFEFESGRVKKIVGLQDAKRLEGVLDLDLEFSEGSILKSANDDRSRQGYVIVFAETENQLDARLQHVINTVRVILE